MGRTGAVDERRVEEGRMSTKIFYAFRLKSKDLPKFLIAVRKKKTELKQKAIHSVASQVARDNIDIEDPKFIEQHLMKRRSIMYGLCQNLEMSMASMQDGFTYIKLHGDMDHIRTMCDQFDKMSYVEDYHYQNQTEAPEEIGEKAFSRRGTKWDLVTGGTSYSTMLTIELIPDFILEMYPFELQDLIRQKKGI